MNTENRSPIAKLALSFVGPNRALAFGAIIVDWTLFLAGVLTAVLAEPVWLKVAASLTAGTAIATLFILGHDAGHRNLVIGKKWNAILARIVFLPCLHNYTLWVLQHNRIHHSAANVRYLNSFAPMSHEEFLGSSRTRRAMERIYRSPFGFGIYYLRERWWRDKFFPRETVPHSLRVRAWIDFAILLFSCLFFCLGLGFVGYMSSYSTPLSALWWGGLLPFLIWNQLMGTTAFFQHTHPEIRWYRTPEDAEQSQTQAERTVLVQCPAWYDILSHNIMQHQAHHINARIPWFRLKVAQAALSPLLGPEVIRERIRLPYLVRLVRTCQLYDYENRSWLTFSGQSSNLPTRLGFKASEAVPAAATDHLHAA